MPTGYGKQCEKQRRLLARMQELPAPPGGARPPTRFPFEVHFHEERAADAELAFFAWTFACSLVKHRCLSSSHYADVPPGQFAALLSPSVEDCANALAEQKLNWTTLLNVEQRMYDGASVANIPALLQVVRKIGFLHHDVPREVLAVLAQHDFRMLPPGARNTLEAWFRGIGSSRPNEKAFNKTKTSGEFLGQTGIICRACSRSWKGSLVAKKSNFAAERCCPPACQEKCYRLILKRWAGSHPFPTKNCCMRSGQRTKSSHAPTRKACTAKLQLGACFVLAAQATFRGLMSGRLGNRICFRTAGSFAERATARHTLSLPR